MLSMDGSLVGPGRPKIGMRFVHLGCGGELAASVILFIMGASMGWIPEWLAQHKRGMGWRHVCVTLGL